MKRTGVTIFAVDLRNVFWHLLIVHKWLCCNNKLSMKSVVDLSHACEQYLCPSAQMTTLLHCHCYIASAQLVYTLSTFSTFILKSYRNSEKWSKKLTHHMCWMRSCLSSELSYIALCECKVLVVTCSIVICISTVSASLTDADTSSLILLLKLTRRLFSS